MRTKTANYGAFSKAMGRFAAKPVKGMANMAKDFLLGRKLPAHVAKSPTGIGRRMREHGMKSISPEEYARLRKDPDMAKYVAKRRSPTGKEQYVKTTFRPGGLAGVAAEYPKSTALLAGIGGTVAMTRKPQPSSVVNVYNRDTRTQGYGDYQPSGAQYL